MSQPLDLSTDWHTHTNQSDGRDSVADMVAAAAEKGMTRLHITDHVREDSAWLPDYIQEVNRVRSAASIDVVCGIEAKMLDLRGAIDAPADLTGVEQVVVADHQFPTRRGPVTPQEMAVRLAEGQMRPEDVVADLVTATSRAVFQHERVVVGHVFSVLPKAGISLDVITDDMLDTLATSVRAAGAVIETNEKWATPLVPMIQALCARGVDLVPSSDAHRTEEIGAWEHVKVAADAIVH